MSRVLHLSHLSISLLVVSSCSTIKLVQLEHCPNVVGNPAIGTSKLKRNCRSTSSFPLPPPPHPLIEDHQPSGDFTSTRRAPRPSFVAFNRHLASRRCQLQSNPFLAKRLHCALFQSSSASQMEKHRPGRMRGCRTQLHP